MKNLKLVWFPTWRCQNYDRGKSHSHRCPYCPYGFDAAENRLLYENNLASPAEECDWHVPAEMLQRNVRLLGNSVEISGGEPLVYDHLVDVLDKARLHWGITSNTVRTSVIEDMHEASILPRCLSWTASYHPCSERDDEFAESIFFLATRGIRARVTTVVSRVTLDYLESSMRLLSTLPISGMQWHLDTHAQMTDDEIAEARKIIGNVTFEAGEAPTGAMCRKRDRLLALGPDGSVYPCVTYCYQGINRLGAAAEMMKLSDHISHDAEWCDDECFACCDWVKHEGRA